MKVFPTIHALLALAVVFLPNTVALQETEGRALQSRTTRICHKRRYRQGYTLQYVNSNRLRFHMRHGDGYVGRQVPNQRGYVFDQRCRPVKNQTTSNSNLTCRDCPRGFYDGCNSCRCIGGRAACTKRACPRRGKAYCECAKDTKRCGDGSRVKRDPLKNCNFAPCTQTPSPPRCCNRNSRPFCRGEGSACCPNGEWNCSIGDGKTFQCDGKLITSGFGPICGGGNSGCQEDLKICPGGRSLSRDPKNNCRFPACPTTNNCTQDVKSCPGGTSVGRDPNKGCAFKPCPEFSCCNARREPGKFGNPICFEGHRCCPDGVWSCSIGDGKTFPCGGKQVTSGFSSACKDDTCCDPSKRPGTNVCMGEGSACCPDGNWTCSIGDGKTFACGSDLITSGFGKVCGQRNCDTDVKRCPNNGPTLKRDPSNNCRFPSCPDQVACTQDAKTCPDGSSVGRDPRNGCSFFPCPKSTCCDPNARPGLNGGPICSDGVRCCPDGKWSCGIGNGSFPCGGRQIRSGFGEVCGGGGGGGSTVDCKKCPNGYFDGCNTCSCPRDGTPALCTLRACSPFELKPATCNRLRSCSNISRLCADGTKVEQDPENDCKYPACPRRKVSCSTCRYGLYDGCNNCGCSGGRQTWCTRRTCIRQGTPRCTNGGY